MKQVLVDFNSRDDDGNIPVLGPISPLLVDGEEVELNDPEGFRGVGTIVRDNGHVAVAPRWDSFEEVTPTVVVIGSASDLHVVQGSVGFEPQLTGFVVDLGRRNVLASA